MKIQFEKYQGTGNDFIMLNNLEGRYNDLSTDQITKLCHRRFGIGADGLIKINAHPDLDFEVDYYNADGSKSFCGNGARCAVVFAGSLGIDVESTRFLAIDGEHSARKKGETVSLDMLPVSTVNQLNSDFVLNTGSPHYVRFVEDLEEQNIYKIGQEIRYSDQFKIEGINVNLVEKTGDKKIRIQTYERGVEDETLSCGTGATACALVEGLLQGEIGEHTIDVEVKGGQLKVSFINRGNGKFDNIRLIGSAVFVFKGEMDV